MGKKSSQKKQKKLKRIEEKNAEGKKSTEENFGGKVSANASSLNTSSSSGNARFTKLLQKFLAFLIMIAGLIALAFLGIFIWGELTKPASIAKFIPQDAVGFVEFDTDIAGNSWQNYHNLTEGKNFPTIASLIEKVNTTFNIDMMKDVYPWLLRRAGIALLSDKKAAIFLEVRDENRALNFFRQHRLASITEDLQEEYIEGAKTYHYIASSPISLTFLGKYLVVASDSKAMEQILKAAHSKTPLFSNKDFQRVNNAVPQRDRLGFVFARPGQLTRIVPSLPNIFSESLMQNFMAEGASIKALDHVFAIEHVALFSGQNGQGMTSLKPLKKYRGELMRAFSDKTQAYMGGENMAFVTDKINAVCTSYFNKTIKNVFDDNVSIEEIKTLLNGEYAFGMDDGQWKMVIELTNPTEQEKILKKIIEGIKSSRVLFQPTIENDTVKGSAKNMKNTRTTYKNITIQGAEIDGGPKDAPSDTSSSVPEGIYLAIDNNVAIITLSAEAMRRTIDAMNGGVPGLKGTKSYTDYIKPQLQAGDDIIYARPHDMEKMLPDVLKFLTNIREISLATNSFEDGMKTIILFSP